MFWLALKRFTGVREMFEKFASKSPPINEGVPARIMKPFHFRQKQKGSLCLLCY